SNCAIVANTAAFGGGIYLYSPGGQVMNSEIRSNSASDAGGGCYALSRSDVVVNSRIEGNTSLGGGGGAYSGTLQGCTVSGNRTTNASGGGAFGSALVQCVVCSNAVFHPSGASPGGGVYQGSLDRCLVTGNFAQAYGGGVSECQATNCLITANAASECYAAAYSETLLVNCTVAGNHAEGSAIGYTTLLNTIVSGNTGGDTDGSLGGASFSCAPGLTDGVNGNLSCPPLFANPAAGDYTLNLNSPCINAGTNLDWMGSSTDLVGNPRILGAKVDMGAYEYNALQAIGAISASLAGNATNAARGGLVPFNASVFGRASGCLWDWGDGATTTGLFTARHAFPSNGAYTVRFTVWNLSGTNSAKFTVVIVEPTTRYVSLTGGHTSPFTNLVDAATNIQAAVDVSLPGDTVLVASGVYSNGFVSAAGAENSVNLDRAVALRGIDGPGQTVIWADRSLYSQRGAHVAPGAMLAGFTIRNGYAVQGGGVYNRGFLLDCLVTNNSARQGGGGVYCTAGGVVSNCVVAGCFASTEGSLGGGGYGGGVNGQGTLYDCMVRNNTADGGGGVAGVTAVRCILMQNTARYYPNGGGGALNATLFNCLVISNESYWIENGKKDLLGQGTNDGKAHGMPDGPNPKGLPAWAQPGIGGGPYGGALCNCTVVGNTAYGGSGAGTFGSTLWNCIVWDNTGSADVDGGSANFTCLPVPSPSGVGNFTNAPLFLNEAAGDFRLAPNSPCINAGMNQDWMIGALDLAGFPRIVGGTVDMGAYETPLRITACALVAPNRFRLEWSGASNGVTILFSPTLPATNWQTVTQNVTGASCEITCDPPSPSGFYRLQQ
ncbi:MAG: PKD domain-containing protein, partial [Verrucomicrobia bacterium]|nr:PKD domain-containing protein [Verrucomicrobiota bacterium]